MVFTAGFSIKLPDGTQVGRRHLRQFFSEIFKLVVKNSIQSVLELGLSDGQKIKDLIIISISQSGNLLNIESRVTLEEKCNGSCEGQLESTTIASIITDHLNEVVADGSFIETLQTEAAKSEECDECQEIESATLTARVTISDLILLVTTTIPTATPTTSTPSTKPASIMYLWVPDWQGSNKGCILSPSSIDTYSPKYNEKDTCCLSHYKWDYATCSGGTVSSPAGWYPVSGIITFAMFCHGFKVPASLALFG
jgi:hypothetical protein